MRNAVAIIFISLLLSLAAAGLAAAVNDSVSTALDIVNDFYAEAVSLVDTVDEAKVTFKATALEKKGKTLFSFGYRHRSDKGAAFRKKG